MTEDTIQSEGPKDGEQSFVLASDAIGGQIVHLEREIQLQLLRNQLAILAILDPPADIPWKGRWEYARARAKETRDLLVSLGSARFSNG